MTALNPPIVECVPNISEGRDFKVIRACAAAASVPGVTLLNIDAGYDTNRTVITFAGTPDAVLEGAFRLISESYKRIDMTLHKGEHPRSGATDVCPFVPVSGTTMADCVQLARRLGERVGRELQLPVYLYESAATRPERQNLAVLRKGGYEALPQKMQDPLWKPDFGPQAFVPEFGLVHIGARKFLGAYNINLDTADRKQAADIALSLREKGRAARNEKGEIIRDSEGKAVKIQGLFKYCKAAAWYLERLQRCQITMNLTDLDVTEPHQVFEKTRELAAERGMRVTGSEIIGLIPLKPMLDAGRYFLKKRQLSTDVSEAEWLQAAIDALGLNEISPFDPQKKILEYALKAPPQFDLTC